MENLTKPSKHQIVRGLKDKQKQPRSILATSYVDYSTSYQLHLNRQGNFIIYLFHIFNNAGHTLNKINR